MSVRPIGLIIRSSCSIWAPSISTSKRCYPSLPMQPWGHSNNENKMFLERSRIIFCVSRTHFLGFWRLLRLIWSSLIGIGWAARNKSNISFTVSSPRPPRSARPSRIKIVSEMAINSVRQDGCRIASERVKFLSARPYLIITWGPSKVPPGGISVELLKTRRKFSTWRPLHRSRSKRTSWMLKRVVRKSILRMISEFIGHSHLLCLTRVWIWTAIRVTTRVVRRGRLSGNRWRNLWERVRSSSTCTIRLSR